MQPAQLSLLSDGVPALPPELLAQLPEEQVGALELLARLIANAAAAASSGEVGNE